MPRSLLIVSTKIAAIVSIGSGKVGGVLGGHSLCPLIDNGRRSLGLNKRNAKHSQQNDDGDGCAPGPNGKRNPTGISVTS
jgi:hypothetical protein